MCDTNSKIDSNMSHPIEVQMEVHEAKYPIGLEPQSEKYIKLSIKADFVGIVDIPKTIYAYSDVSGSMSDVCNDNRTKQQHINHTWCNLLHYIADNEFCNVKIKMQSFDDELEEVIPLIRPTKENVSSLTEKVNKMRPQNSTDIGMVLENIGEINSVQGKSRKYFLMMTDGEATTGMIATNKLVELLPEDTRFAGIAFGTNHNAELMNKLGDKNVQSSNWLVSDLEKSGVVYGEILSKWLYEVVDNVLIKLENGLIYNYRNNEWVSELKLGSLSSEEVKQFHVKSDTPELLKLHIQYEKMNTDNNTTTHEIMKTMNECLNKENQKIDLTREMYRLRVQELIYEAKQINYNMEKYSCNYNYNSDSDDDESQKYDVGPPRLIRQQTCHFTPTEQCFPPPPRLRRQTNKPIRDNGIIEIKRKMNAFKEIMLDYIKNNELEEDVYFQVLIGDLDIAYRKIGTPLGGMYLSALTTSQGRQQSQVVDDIEEDDYDMELNNVFGAQSVKTPRRPATNTAYASPVTMNSIRSMTTPM